MARLLVLLLLASGGQGARVKEFKEGDPVTLSFEGDLTEGCKFMMSRMEEGRRVTCCYSVFWRGEEWCDPTRQSKECRGQEEQEVKEVLTSSPLGNCTLRLAGGVNLEDQGTYIVMFPKWLKHNVEFEIRVNAISEEMLKYVLIAIIAVILLKY